jgi:general stress protein 26
MGQLKKPTSQAENLEIQHFLALVKKFDTAMLVTRTPEGESRARPMAVASVEETGDVWFVSRREDPKVAEIAADERVLVVMQGSASYLSISGHAETIKERGRVEELWSPGWKIWFKDKDDPNLLLIRVRPLEVEFWDQTGVEGARYLLRAAAAFVSGRQLAGSEHDPKQHGKIKNPS